MKRCCTKVGRWLSTILLLSAFLLFLGCSNGTGLVSPESIGVVKAEGTLAPETIFDNTGTVTDTNVAIGTYTAIATPTALPTSAFELNETPTLDSPSFSTDDYISCTLDYAEKDSNGVALSPTFFFYNKKDPNTPRYELLMPAGIKTAYYRLKKLEAGRTSLESDIRGDKVYCIVRITNGLTTLTSSPSSEQTLLDAAPTLLLSAGALIQTGLHAGDSISPIQFGGSDPDGDTVTFEEIEKSCVGISLDTTSGIVAGQVPNATTPPTDKICTASIRAKANGKNSTNTMTISIQIPNHQPVVSCSNRTQTLVEGEAPFPVIQCVGSDSDVGSVLTFGISGCNNSFTINSSGLVSGVMPYIDSSLTDRCTATVTLSDGALNTSQTLTFVKSANSFISLPQGHRSHTTLFGNSPRAIVGNNSHLFVALADNGGLAVSTDSGATFRTRTSNSGTSSLGTNNVTALALNGTKLYVASSELDSNEGTPGVYLSTDNGSTFSLTGGVDGAFSQISFFDITSLAANGTYVFVGTSKGLFASADSGNNYTLLTDSEGFPLSGGVGPDASAVNAIHIDSSNPANVYVGTDDGIALSTDFGVSWTVEEPTNSVIKGISGTGSTIYAATQDKVAISTNSGSTFSYFGTLEGLPANSTNSLFVNAGRLFVCTSLGIAISTDNATTWTVRDQFDGLSTNGCTTAFASGTRVYTGSEGNFSLSTDSGVTFTTQSVGSSVAQINDVAVDSSSSPYKIFAASADGLLISTDGGASFRKETAGLGSTTVNAVDVNASTVFAATTNGLSISTDSGVTWVTRNTGGAGTIASDTVYDVSYHSSGSLYVATSNGLSISTNDGTDFDNVLPGVSLSGGVVRRGTKVVVGTATGVRISNDTASTFGAVISAGLPSATVYSLHANTSGAHIYVGTANGLGLSTDGGTSFSTVAAVTANTHKIHGDGNFVSAATDSGLAISEDSGTNFQIKTMSNGLNDLILKSVFFDGTYVWSGTGDGQINWGRAEVSP